MFVKGSGRGRNCWTFVLPASLVGIQRKVEERPSKWDSTRIVPKALEKAFGLLPIYDEIKASVCAVERTH